MNKLEISGLTKVYPGPVHALDNLSLSIGHGMFGLLGPNGAGKSTLMRTIATLQQPDQGSVFFNGHDVLKEPQQLRSQLGYLPQEFGVYPRMSALRLLDHLAVLKGLLNKAERREQVLALLELTNLYEHRKKSVSTFSGGMRQRFGIAQALLGAPRLVIVDEPTAGLDPAERNRFHNMLSEIGENMVVLLSTHIVEDVRDLCSKMAVMAEGKVLSQGEPQSLIDSLKGSMWRKTVSKDAVKAHQTAFNVISRRLFAGKTQLHVWSAEDPGQGFEAIEPGLEDVYFSLLFGSQTDQTARYAS